MAVHIIACRVFEPELEEVIKQIQEENVFEPEVEMLKELNSRLKNILCDVELAKLTKAGLTVQKAIVDGDFCREQNASDNGYGINHTRHHHEVYLSDPRKIAAEKLK